MRIPLAYRSSAAMYAATFVGVVWGWAANRLGCGLAVMAGLATLCSVPMFLVGWFLAARADRGTVESEAWACLATLYSLFSFARACSRPWEASKCCACSWSC